MNRIQSAEPAGVQQEEREYPYFDMYSEDGSNIAFEYWADSRSVGLHRHGYYELLFVAQGSCRHLYNHSETLLIQGDAVVVAAHQPHGFSIHGTTRIYNCQFRLDALETAVIEELQAEDSLWEIMNGSNYEDVRIWEDLRREREKYYQDGQLPDSYELNSTKQGVIHLSPKEFSFIHTALQHAIDEQETPERFGPVIKRIYLEMILLELKKAKIRQNQKYHVCSGSNQKIIAEVLLYIEEHLDETLDFHAIAQHYAFSLNYFRKIFKDVTGLSPVAYVNRLRIVRACEYMQKDDLTIHEAAERVGIYDLNYFSRMFKKVMGCTPSTLS